MVALMIQMECNGVDGISRGRFLKEIEHFHISLRSKTRIMAADITLWQMLQDTKNQKIETKKDYISALWAEYKREPCQRSLRKVY